MIGCQYKNVWKKFPEPFFFLKKKKCFTPKRKLNNPQKLNR